VARIEFWGGVGVISPYRLHPVGGPARLVVEYARAYDFAGQPVRARS
jgi:ribonuclease J